jgi:acyl-lipid omega-6 desaturase (Delta-12 desaturase)
VVTLTPYDVWRRTHAVHHASAGHLGKRGMGDVLTLTVASTAAGRPFGRLRYRLYRHPIVCSVWAVLPFLPPEPAARRPHAAGIAVLDQRDGNQRGPRGGSGDHRLLRRACGSSLAVFLPMTVIAASIGVWMFYVQHQFEETSWDHDPDWQLHDAALHGSSHYVLPGILRWFTANIGVHHVHHLQSRVPFYRLPEILRDHPQLAEAQRLTLRESLEGRRTAALGRKDPPPRLLRRGPRGLSAASGPLPPYHA